LLGDAGLRNEIEEAGVDPLEGGGLRVRDVAGNVFQGVGIRPQARDGRGECAEDTHDIFSNSFRAAWPQSGEDVASVVPKLKFELDQLLE
jgi:hypothetical protein